MAIGDPWLYPLQVCSCASPYCRERGCALQRRPISAAQPPPLFMPMPQQPARLADFEKWLRGEGEGLPRLKPRYRVKAGRKVVQ